MAVLKGRSRGAVNVYGRVKGPTKRLATRMMRRWLKAAIMNGRDFNDIG